jgi:CheY-like chemotaxis protein
MIKLPHKASQRDNANDAEVPQTEELMFLLLRKAKRRVTTTPSLLARTHPRALKDKDSPKTKDNPLLALTDKVEEEDEEEDAEDEVEDLVVKEDKAEDKTRAPLHLHTRITC